MVRILSSGEIVQDDDPQSSNTSPRNTQTGPRQHAGRGSVNQAAADQEPHYHMPQMGNAFDSLNDRLSAAGVPRWNLGPYVVEPIVSLGFLVALLLIGLHGLLLGLLLFFVCKWSTGGRTEGGQGQGFAGWQGRGLGMQGGGVGGVNPQGGGGFGASSNENRPSRGRRGQNWGNSGNRLGRS